MAGARLLMLWIGGCWFMARLKTAQEIEAEPVEHGPWKTIGEQYDAWLETYDFTPGPSGPPLGPAPAIKLQELIDAQVSLGEGL
jgi:hypothetical protein